MRNHPVLAGMFGTLVVLALLVGGIVAYSGTTNANGDNGGIRALTSAQTDDTDDNDFTCSTNDEMQQAHGWLTDDDPQPVFTGNDIAWEPCQWVMQSVAPFELPILKGWQYTVRLNEQRKPVAVYYGDDTTTLDVLGFTARELDGYNTDASDFANNACELLDFEHGYGMNRKRPYPTFNGNLPCDSVPVGTAPDGTVMTEWMAGGEANGGSGNGSGINPTPKEGASQYAGCKSDDPTWYATNIGGDATLWVEPEHPTGAWTYLQVKDNDTSNDVHMKFPGFGQLDVWIGTGAKSITKENIDEWGDELATAVFDEASFHCTVPAAA